MLAPRQRRSPAPNPIWPLPKGRRTWFDSMECRRFGGMVPPETEMITFNRVQVAATAMTGRPARESRNSCDPSSAIMQARQIAPALMTTKKLPTASTVLRICFSNNEMVLNWTSKTTCTSTKMTPRKMMTMIADPTLKLRICHRDHEDI